MDFYFDNAATTKLSERAAKTYIKTSQDFPGNPSSIHREGLKAKEELERRREECATILGVKPECLVFTSGATESIGQFFSSLLWQEPGEMLISRIEHEAVSSWMPILTQYGWKITKLKAKKGFVTVDEVKEKLSADTKVVAIMSVNNALGTIQNIREHAKAIREFESERRRKILFFSDSVQALGKTDLDLTGWDVDGASFSSHKINGPRGIGLLYLKNPASFRSIAPAGGQERGKRGGTENLPSIAAFTEALKEWYEEKDEKEPKISKYNTLIRSELEAMDMKILTPEENVSPYILTIATKLPSEVFTRMLMDKGICVSSGSACSNNAKGKTESILEAMGIKHDDSTKAIRISLTKDTKEEEVNELIKAFKEILHG